MNGDECVPYFHVLLFCLSRVIFSLIKHKTACSVRGLLIYWFIAKKIRTRKRGGGCKCKSKRGESDCPSLLSKNWLAGFRTVMPKGIDNV